MPRVCTICTNSERKAAQVQKCGTLQAMYQNSRGYWYRSQRSGSRVVKEYCGSGLVAALGAQLDAADAMERRHDRARGRAELARLDALDKEVKAMFDAAAVVLKEALQAAGYHQHDRGQWRKQRTQPLMSTDAQQAQAQPRKAPGDLKALMQKARKSEAACKELFAFTDAKGTTRALVQINDMACQAEMSLRKKAYEGDVLADELCARRLKELRREVAGPCPTPLETLLAERIALCWLTVHIYETVLAQQGGEMTFISLEHHQKRIDKAHKRYLASIKALAQVRRLQLPSVQINVGAQVNAIPYDKGGAVATTWDG